MIEIARGDIVKADAEALVNTVNCVGFMGRGIALQFKRVFPANFEAYERACRRDEVVPGRMLVHETGYLTGPRFIINFPTKRHWRAGSRIDDIQSGLDALTAEVRRLGIRSIAVPPLGCGLGGLDWQQVKPLIQRAFAPLPDVHVLLFEPSGTPPPALDRTPEERKLTPGRAPLVGLVARYLAGLMDPYVTLLEIHKLMYFMQEAGESLRLSYAKAQYGPYSSNLRHVLAKVEGQLLVGYDDGVDDPNKQMGIVPGAAQKAESFLTDYPETRARYDRVGDLVEGFETPFGMELLASVHWVASREGASSSAEATRLMYAWNDRKRRFSESQIALAWNVLVTKGWLRDEGRSN